MPRQYGNFNATNFVFARFESNSTHGLVAAHNDLVDGLFIFVRMKALLRLVLHVEEVADPLLVPTKPPQIIAATAFVQGKQKRVIFGSNCAQTYRGKSGELGHRWGILV